MDGLFGLGWAVPHIVLPLAISFFTFQQIAYLSDAHDGVAVEHALPELLPLRHLLPAPDRRSDHPSPGDAAAIRGPRDLRPHLDGFVVGGTLFLLGLFKKVMIADQISAYVAPVFTAGQEAPLTLLPAWGGAVAYALQIYFDFSGYTDMAIGLGLLFGISLPPISTAPTRRATSSNSGRAGT